MSTMLALGWKLTDGLLYSQIARGQGFADFCATVRTSCSFIPHASICQQMVEAPNTHEVPISTLEYKKILLSTSIQLELDIQITGKK